MSFALNISTNLSLSLYVNISIVTDTEPCEKGIKLVDMNVSYNSV